MMDVSGYLHRRREGEKETEREDREGKRETCLRPHLRYCACPVSQMKIDTSTPDVHARKEFTTSLIYKERIVI